MWKREEEVEAIGSTEGLFSDRIEGMGTGTGRGQGQDGDGRGWTENWAGGAAVGALAGTSSFMLRPAEPPVSAAPRQGSPLRRGTRRRRALGALGWHWWRTRRAPGWSNRPRWLG